MNRILSYVVFFVLLLSCANAQDVRQSGTVTPGHVTRWITNGVVGDGGPLGGGASLNGTFNAFDFLCANSMGAAPLIISCGSPVTGGLSVHGVLGVLNIGSTGPIDLQTAVPTNGFYASGVGAVIQNCPLIGCLSGDHQQSALYLKATATRDASIGEYMSTLDCNLNSGSTGVSVGPNHFSDARVCSFISSVTGSNTGYGAWGQALDFIINDSLATASRQAFELDISNNGSDCVVGGPRACFGLQISGLVTNPITAYLTFGPPADASHIGSHYAILVNGRYVSDLVDIENSSGAAVGICNGCLTPQPHSIAGFDDHSTTPVGYFAQGTYSVAAFASAGFIVGPTGLVAIAGGTAPPGGGGLVLQISSTPGLGIFISNGTPSATAADGSIDIDSTGKLWLRTSGVWTQVTVP